MILNTVTLTGIDDLTPISQLNQLSRQYKFIEWGILFNEDKEIGPRIPSKEWRTKFLRVKNNHVKLSAHICGITLLNNLCDKTGYHRLFIKELSKFNRVQLNLDIQRTKLHNVEVYRICKCLLEEGMTIILEYNEYSKAVIDYTIQSLNTNHYKSIEILMDSSLGQGITVDKWPKPISIKLPVNNEHFEFYTGYAGGINPINVYDQVNKLNLLTTNHRNTSRYWIDMESGIRTNNLFDLNKVLSIVQQVSPLL